MLAKILDNNSIYYSPVFAISTKGVHSQAVVFDSAFSQLIVVDIFDKYRYKLFFIDYNTDGYAIDEDQFKSYWNDKHIFRSVRRKKYTSAMLAEAKAVLSKSNVREWIKIKNQSDLEALQINTGSFHDGYVLGMCEKDGTLEILLDTSWGAFILLKCQGVIENDLIIGQMYYDCEMHTDNACTELSFDHMTHSGKATLKAKTIEYLPLFEKRIKINDYEYLFESGCLILKQNNGNHITKVNIASGDILDFKQRSIAGYYLNNDEVTRCFIFCDDIVYTLRNNKAMIKLSEKQADPIQEFCEYCNNNGICFDEYALDYDQFDREEYEWGQLIYSRTYSKFIHLLYILKISCPIFLFYNLFSLIVQLFNPQMEWVFYWIFGIGVPSFVIFIGLLVCIIASIRNKIWGNPEPKYIGIYENGVQYFGYNIAFVTDYESIEKLDYKKRITIHVHGMKYSLHKTKDDEQIYKLIQDKISKAEVQSNPD